MFPDWQLAAEREKKGSVNIKYTHFETSEQETRSIWIKNLAKPKEAQEFKIGYKVKENDRSQIALLHYIFVHTFLI